MLIIFEHRLGALQRDVFVEAAAGLVRTLWQSIGRLKLAAAGLTRKLALYDLLQALIGGFVEISGNQSLENLGCFVDATGLAARSGSFAAILHVIKN